MNSLKCPVCRRDMDPPLKIKKMIEDNQTQYEAETAENYVIDLIGDLSKLPEIPLEVQMNLALEYVQRLGFPSGESDGVVELNLVCQRKDEDIFSKIVNEVVKIKKKDLEEGKRSNVNVKVALPKEFI